MLSKKLLEMSPSSKTENGTVRKAIDLFIRLDKEYAIVQDRIGMVIPRILCMVINESFFALMEGIADARDIDTAMKLGMNYPSGPIELAKKIGLRQVLAILNALHADLGEERYRPAPILRQLAFSEFD